MAERFRNKYRIGSIRAQWWNYGWNGFYFITICTANRNPYFGNVVNKEMHLSRTGVIADILWYEIPRHDPNIELGNFIVMPDHIHGILILNRPGQSSDPVESPTDSVEIKNERMSEISPKAHSISAVVRSYKSAVTKHANRIGLENGWQSRYYDHIIRNEGEFRRISRYITNNPKNWKG